MRGLMMDYQLSIPAILRRAGALFPEKSVVSRLADRSVVRHRYRDILERARRLAVALSELGVKPGERVATLAWASHAHLEAYLAVPAMGAVLHTLNLRLHDEELAYIINDADDRVVILDESLLPLYEKLRSRVNVPHLIVVSQDPRARSADTASSSLDYEQLLAASDPSRYSEPAIDERDAAAMCYTSGTTGRPKGVLYSHRAIMLHSLAQGLRDCMSLAEDDTVLPIVPMFHVNAWGLPFTSTWFGCNQVYPGPHLDPQSVLSLLVAERVTLTAGVPTVWLGVLQELDKNPGKYDLSHLRTIVIGGSAAPESMIRAYQERHGLKIVHAWGMTEMTPLGTLCNLPASLAGASEDEKYRYRAKQGTPMPLVEIRATGDNGSVPWDAQTMGELEVRGPWIASQYYGEQGLRSEIHGRRVVQDRRHRDHHRLRVHRDRRSHEGSGEVGRRMDQFGGARDGAHGPSGDRRSGSHRGSPSEMGRAPARRGGAETGEDGKRRRSPGVSRAQVRQVVAARRVRIRRRDSADVGRQVQEVGAQGPLSGTLST